MSLKLSRSWITFVAAAATLAPMAFSSPDRVIEAVEVDSAVRNALQVTVTQRGEEYFANNLKELIERAGFSLSEGGIARFDFKAKEPMDLSKLPVQYRKFHGTLSEVRDVFQEWLTGFKLQNPLFEASFRDIFYNLTIDKLGVRVERLEIPEANGRTAGLSLVLEAVISGMEVATSEVRAQDLNNPFLKTFGVDNFWTGMHAKSEPLRISIPARIDLDGAGQFRVAIRDVETNFGNIQLEAIHDLPLLLPQVAVVVNGQRMTVSQSRVEAELVRKLPDLLKALQAYADNYVREKLPNELNRILAEKLHRPLTEVNQMTPPGAPAGLAYADRFRWTLAAESLGFDRRNQVNIGFAMTVEDPKTAPSRVQSPLLSHTQPKLGAVSPKEYDVALSINQELVNRILKLSYERGYFNYLRVNEDTSVSFIAAPEFRVDETTDRDRSIVHFTLETKVKGLPELAIRNPFKIAMDAEVRLTRKPNGDVGLSLIRIVPESAVFPDSSLHVAASRPLVEDAVRSKLNEANLALAREEYTLVEKLPVPRNLGGIPIRVKEFLSDPHGYVVLYAEIVKQENLK